MDIRKFITSDKIDSDYNVLIQREMNIIKKKTKVFDNNITYVYRVSELDFLKPCIPVIDMFKDQNILEFEDMCINKNHIGYSGPMIKKYLDPNYGSKEIQIKNYYYVSILNPVIKLNEILKEDHLSSVKTINGLHTIELSQSIFYIDNKNNVNMLDAIFSNFDILDRIILCNNDLWISGMFILELYKKISCYNASLTDPMYGYPEDIFDIYDRTSVREKNVATLIEMIDIDGIKSIDKEKIETILIPHDNQKYTVLEYALLKLVEITHPVLIYHMKSLILYLSTFQYARPIYFLAIILGINKLYPELYESFIKLSHAIDIDHNSIIAQMETLESLESLYHVDMFIINHLIKLDNEDLFVDYITKIGLLKKFKQESKTAEKIIEWLIEYKAINIIKIMIDCMIVTNQTKYKLIFLTEEFSLLGEEFINKYIRKRDSNKNMEGIDIDEHMIDNYPCENDKLDNEQLMIISNLFDTVINGGLIRSFHIILKMCPNFLNEKNSSGGNILHSIRSDMAHNILEYIIRNNRNIINDRDELGRTPLIIYSENKLKVCITRLLECGADYEMTDNNSDTFLHKLCANGSVDIVRSIIRNVKSIIDFQNDKLMTPAIISAINRHEELFYILKGINANLNITDIYGNTVYHYICQSRICPGIMIANKKNKFGFTPYDYCNIHHKIYYFQY